MNFKNNNTSLKKYMDKEGFASFEGEGGYVRIDISGNIKEMDKKAIEILGYNNVNEPVNARKMIHKEDFAYTMKSFMTLYNKGEFKNYNARIIVKDGTIKRVHIDTRMIYNSNNKPIAAHGLIKEIEILGSK